MEPKSLRILAVAGLAIAASAHVMGRRGVEEYKTDPKAAKATEQTEGYPAKDTFDVAKGSITEYRYDPRSEPDVAHSPPEVHHVYENLPSRALVTAAPAFVQRNVDNEQHPEASTYVNGRPVVLHSKHPEKLRKKYLKFLVHLGKSATALGKHHIHPLPNEEVKANEGAYVGLYRLKNRVPHRLKEYIQQNCKPLFATSLCQLYVNGELLPYYVEPGKHWIVWLPVDPYWAPENIDKDRRYKVSSMTQVSAKTRDSGGWWPGWFSTTAKSSASTSTKASKPAFTKPNFSSRPAPSTLSPSKKTSRLVSSTKTSSEKGLSMSESPLTGTTTLHTTVTVTQLTPVGTPSTKTILSYVTATSTIRPLTQTLVPVKTVKVSLSQSSIKPAFNRRADDSHHADAVADIKLMTPSHKRKNAVVTTSIISTVMQLEKLVVETAPAVFIDIYPDTTIVSTASKIVPRMEVFETPVIDEDVALRSSLNFNHFDEPKEHLPVKIAAAASLLKQKAKESREGDSSSAISTDAKIVATGFPKYSNSFLSNATSMAVGDADHTTFKANNTLAPSVYLSSTSVSDAKPVTSLGYSYSLMQPARTHHHHDWPIRTPTPPPPPESRISADREHKSKDGKADQEGKFNYNKEIDAGSFNNENGPGNGGDKQSATWHKENENLGYKWDNKYSWSDKEKEGGVRGSDIPVKPVEVDSLWSN